MCSVLYCIVDNIMLAKSRGRSHTRLLEYTCIKSINMRVFNTRKLLQYKNMENKIHE
jgi:hypothetical protein